MELDELKSKYEETKLKLEIMKKEKSENNKRLLELSGVVKSLQDIPIKYEKSTTPTTTGIDGSSGFDNVQRKIVAIDTEMKKAKERYDELLNEKSFQTDTILSQELHIISMKDQIQELTQQAEKSNNNTNGELEQTIQLQEQQIENLVGEIGELKKDDIVHVNTTTNTTNTDSTDNADTAENSLEANKAAKYSEISKLEEKLENLREEQNERKIQANIMKSKREEDKNQGDKRRVVIDDDEKQHQHQRQHSNGTAGTAVTAVSTFSSKRTNSSQPWNRDLAWKKDILDETSTEEEKEKDEKDTEVVDKIMLVDDDDHTGEPPSLACDDDNDDDHHHQKENQSNYTTEPDKSEDNNHDDADTPNSLLTLPTLTKRHTVKSARRKKTSAFGAIGGSVGDHSSVAASSICSDQSPDAISEESDVEKESSVRFNDKNKNTNSSDTSVMEGSSTLSTPSLSASPLACDMSSSDEESSNINIDYNVDGNPQQDKYHGRLVKWVLSEDGSVECESVKVEQDQHLVELIESSDGSVECESVKLEQDNNDPARQNENENERLTTVLSSSSTEWSSENESSVEYTSGESTQGSSSADYTSCESTQSSSRSVLEQIPEEDDEDEHTDGSAASAWGGASIVENLTQSEDQRAKNTTKQQLDNVLLSQQLKESQAKYVELMEDYNGVVSTSQSKVKTLEKENTKLRKDQSLDRCRRLKEENTMILKNIENQNRIMTKAEMKYERLRDEHTDTLVKLDDKKQQYDLLIMDFTNVADKCKNVENYSRLDALYQAVVMKLGDISEDSDKFEQERDEAREQLQKNTTQIEAYDEAIRDLNETESSYKILQEEHEEAVSQLEELTKKNEVYERRLYENEVAAGKSDSALQQDYADAMTNMEILMRSNKEYAGVESKMNDSGVSVMILEGEVKKSREDLDEAKRKHVERDSQLRDVIAQYKTLKQEHTVKCARLQRLEMFDTDASGDNSMAMKEISVLEKELEQSKNNTEEAVKGKQTREDDLKIVLQHYEKLQKILESTTKELLTVMEKYEDTVEKVEVLERKVNGTKKGAPSVNEVEEEKKEDDGSSNKEEPDGTLSLDELERQLEECQESSSFKDTKIATTMTELKTMKEYVEKLETDKNELQNDLSTLMSELLLARHEVENNAGERQDQDSQETETQLRKAVANHSQLQKVYASLQTKYDSTRSELEKCKQLSKATSVEEQRLRKKATTIQSQYTRLQSDHDVVVERLEKLKIQMV